MKNHWNENARLFRLRLAFARSSSSLRLVAYYRSLPISLTLTRSSLGIRFSLCPKECHMCDSMRISNVWSTFLWCSMSHDQRQVIATLCLLYYWRKQNKKYVCTKWCFSLWIFIQLFSITTSLRCKSQRDSCCQYGMINLFINIVVIRFVLLVRHTERII